jgi:hypothetical protein
MLIHFFILQTIYAEKIKIDYFSINFLVSLNIIFIFYRFLNFSNFKNSKIKFSFKRKKIIKSSKITKKKKEIKSYETLGLIE